MAMLEGYLDDLELKAADEVLALGCGTEVEKRALAGRPGFDGRVTALDINPDLVAKGRAVAVDEGWAERVTWQVGDAQALDFADRTFDLVLVHTLVSHVPRADRVVVEAACVVRRCGSMVVFGGD